MTRPDPMAPGDYLQRRRKAAGLSVEDVAKLLAASPAEAGALEDDIDELEDDDLMAAEAFDLIERLKPVFRFDATIYAALVGLLADDNPELPRPQLCRVCACSWNDPCIDAAGRPCAWAEPDLCTACVNTIPEERRS